MSFILEALQKAENERHRGIQPGLARVPAARAATHLPTWAISAIALLGAATLILAAAWWYTGHPGTIPRAGPTTITGTPAGSAPVERKRLPMPLAAGASAAASTSATSPPDAPPRSTAANAAVATPAKIQHLPDTASVPLRAKAASNLRAANPDAARPRTTSTSTSTPAKPAVEPSTRATLPRYGELAGRDPSLPELTLQLHAYASDPARRFVFINGTKYTAGMTLKEGFRLVEITPTGAILTVKGRDVLLPRS